MPYGLKAIEPPSGKYAITVDGEEIDHADTLAEARRNRDTIIYGEIGTPENTKIQRRPTTTAPAEDRTDKDWWEVFYKLDGEESSIEVLADSDHNARYHAQLQFGSPIEITSVEKI